MSTELRRALEQVAARFRGVRLHGALALCWLAFALIAVGLALLRRAGQGPIGMPPAYLVGWFADLAGVWFAIALADPPVDLRPSTGGARVEAKYPDLGTGLLAAVEEDADVASGGPKAGFTSRPP